eukprot:443103_1
MAHIHSSQSISASQLATIESDTGASLFTQNDRVMVVGHWSAMSDQGEAKATDHVGVDAIKVIFFKLPPKVARPSSELIGSLERDLGLDISFRSHGAVVIVDGPEEKVKVARSLLEMGNEVTQRCHTHL